MGLKRVSTDAAIKERFAQAKARVQMSLVQRLMKVGEELVNHARSISADVGYTDQTGNLRSSTGYIIVVNGQIVSSDFKKIEGPVMNVPKNGVQIGRSYAESLATNYKSGYQLIFVAGMEYALAVESRGRDVLESTELLARKSVPEHLERLKEQIKKMKL